MRRMKRRRSGLADSGAVAWSGGVAVAAACAVGYIALFGLPRLIPIDVKQWFPYFVLAAAALGCLERGRSPTPVGQRRWARAVAVRWLARAVFIGAVVTLSVWPRVVHAWSPPVATAWVAGLCIGMGLIWWSMSGIVSAGTATEASTAFMLVAAGSGIAVMISGSASIGLLAAALAATLAMSVVLAFLGRGVGLFPSAVPVVVTVLVSVWIQGHHYSELPASAAILLAVALPVRGVIDRLPALRRPHRGGLLLRLGLVGLAVIAAILLAWRASPVDDYYY